MARQGRRVGFGRSGGCRPRSSPFQWRLGPASRASDPGRRNPPGEMCAACPARSTRPSALCSLRPVKSSGIMSSTRAIMIQQPRTVSPFTLKGFRAPETPRTPCTLNTSDTKRLPTVKQGWRRIAATTDVASSGWLVPANASVRPMSASLAPIVRAPQRSRPACALLQGAWPAPAGRNAVSRTAPAMDDRRPACIISRASSPFLHRPRDWEAPAGRSARKPSRRASRLQCRFPPARR